MAGYTFDVEAALTAGKTEDEILAHLSENNPNFDTPKAMAAGKTKRQIIDYLASNPTPPQPASRVTEEPLGKQLISGAGRIVSEGGPAGIGAIAGGMAGGPPGAVLGGMGGELIRQLVRRGGGGPAPTSNTEAVAQQLTAGLAGAASPEMAALRYPMGARAGQMGELIPGRMTGKQAQGVLDTAAQTRMQAFKPFKDQRAELANQLRHEKAAAQLEFNQNVEKNIVPLRDESRRMRNYRTAKSAELAEQRTSTGESLRNDLVELNRRTEEAKTTASRQAFEDAQTLLTSVGREMNKSQIRQGTVQARIMGRKALTEQVTKLYNKIRDDVFGKNITYIEKASLKEGDEPVMIAVKGAIDRASLKDDLREFAESYREALTVARQNGSPGAKAVLDIVDGEDIAGGRTVIEDLRGLNEFGYKRADVDIKPGEGIVREVANKYRKLFRDQVAKMKDGQDAIDMLDQAQLLLDKRESLYTWGEGKQARIPIAREAWKKVERTGEALQYMDDPAGMKSLLAQVDATTKQGIIRQGLDDVLGRDYKDFLKNWRNWDSEVKSMFLSPEQIAVGDSIAMRGPVQLDRIANEAILENTRIVRDATEALKRIGIEKKKLGEITVDLRGIQKNIDVQNLSGANEKILSRVSRDVGAANKRKAVADEQDIMRENLLIMERQARQRLREIKEAKIKIGVGAGIAATAAGWKYKNHLMSILGW